MSRRPLQAMTMTITVALRGEDDVELDVTYDVHPGERASFHSPGFPPEIELLTVSRDGKNITAVLTASELKAIEEVVEMEAAEEAKRAAEDYAAERHARRGWA